MKNKDFIIYKPTEREDLNFFKILMIVFHNIIEYRELIWQLFRREFIGQYRKSFLGLSWAFITPLLGVLSWIFMQFTGLLNIGSIDIPYPAYVLIGTSMWGLFVGFITFSAKTLSSASFLIKQINYPHEIFWIQQVSLHLISFSVNFIFNIIILILFGIFPSWKIIFFPLVILPMFFLGSGIGLIIALISVITTDINNILDRFLGLLFFITPVIYTSNINSRIVQILIQWNPLTYIVCSSRDIVIYGRLYDYWGYIICFVFSLLFFLIALRIFYITEKKLIERIF